MRRCRREIEVLEAEDQALQQKINSPEFYKSGSENIRRGARPCRDAQGRARSGLRALGRA